ncbi:MAG: MgtC/SapB family protein [Vallitalea sp.]|jgi:putative Mg2+ transporter-C (MgtC) family protein|nr:MgtC/SapB family protein [Vallitalea sp.]
MIQLPVDESIIRIVLSYLVGAVIGYERESTNRPAGFRTHIIVSLGSCLAMLINYEIFATFGNSTTMDPGRMGSYVISGIGFLGAGTIIKEGASVKGLTTAASLWTSAMLGLALGAGLYKISLVVTVLVIFTLFVVNKIEFRMNVRRTNRRR